MNEIRTVQAECHKVATAHGFWDDYKEMPQEIWGLVKAALVGTEMSEYVEAIRHGNPPSDHCPELSLAEEELADAIIRIFDLAHHHGFDMERAIMLKTIFNETRPYKHGKRA